MHSKRELQHLLAGVLFLLGLVGGIAAYWAVVGPDTLLNRDDNPRLFEQRAGIVRGQLVDRQDNVLVTSVQTESGVVYRDYHHTAMHSALGYYSLRYGEGGAEAAYNSILNGDARPRTLKDLLYQDVLHRPQYGADVRLTLDLAIQNYIADALNGYRGAAIVLSVPESRVLALLSYPTYNPNTLDADWNMLIQAEGNPFFNRALQGHYQPGSSSYTFLIAAALTHNISLDTPYEHATTPIAIADVVLNCMIPPPNDTLTLAEAYHYGCPSPFIETIEQIGVAQVTTVIMPVFQPATLPGFVTGLPAAGTSPPEISLTPRMEDVLGQGNYILNPLQMATFTAALLQDGTVRRPYTLLATRSPNHILWEDAENPQDTLSFTTPEIARQLVQLMRNNISATPDAGENIGGQSALAYSGEGTHIWFNGFIQTSDTTGVVVAIVIEGSADIAFAMQTGIDILRVAAAILSIQ